MKYVYLLWYITPADTHADDALLLGAYSSKKIAQDKIATHYKRQPGFRDHPKGFQISKYELDRMQWTDGFRYAPARKRVRKQNKQVDAVRP